MTVGTLWDLEYQRMGTGFGSDSESFIAYYFSVHICYMDHTGFGIQVHELYLDRAHFPGPGTR